MKFDLKMPCSNCPFRKGQGYLSRSRAREIAQDQGLFTCHKTNVDEVDDDGEETGEMVAVASSQVCAGFIAFNLHAGMPSQALRIAGRLGQIREEDFEGAMGVVYTSIGAMADGHDDDDDDETSGTCCYTGPDCEAPAGFVNGGIITEGEDRVATTCFECGDFVCGPCSRIGIDGKRRCGDCDPFDDEY